MQVCSKHCSQGNPFYRASGLISPVFVPTIDKRFFKLLGISSGQHVQTYGAIRTCTILPIELLCKVVGNAIVAGRKVWLTLDT